MYAIRSLTQVDYNTLHKTETIMQALDWLDLLLSSTSNFHLLSELNDLQEDFRSNGLQVPDKDKFPLRIYNFILRKYNLKLCET